MKEGDGLLPETEADGFTFTCGQSHDTALPVWRAAVAFHAEAGCLWRKFHTEYTTLFGKDMGLCGAPVLMTGRYQKGTHAAQTGERYIVPCSRNGRKQPDDARVALQQHFLYTGGKGKIALECKGPVGEVGLAAACLVTVGME